MLTTCLGFVWFVDASTRMWMPSRKPLKRSGGARDAFLEDAKDSSRTFFGVFMWCIDRIRQWLMLVYFLNVAAHSKLLQIHLQYTQGFCGIVLTGLRAIRVCFLHPEFPCQLVMGFVFNILVNLGVLTQVCIDLSLLSPLFGVASFMLLLACGCHLSTVLRRSGVS